MSPYRGYQRRNGLSFFFQFSLSRPVSIAFSTFRLGMSPCNDSFSGLTQFRSTFRTNLSSSMRNMCPSPFRVMRLSICFRITHEMAAWINKNLDPKKYLTLAVCLTCSMSPSHGRKRNCSSFSGHHSIVFHLKALVSVYDFNFRRLKYVPSFGNSLAIEGRGPGR